MTDTHSTKCFYDSCILAKSLQISAVRIGFVPSRHVTINFGLLQQQCQSGMELK